MPVRRKRGGARVSTHAELLERRNQMQRAINDLAALHNALAEDHRQATAQYNMLQNRITFRENQLFGLWDRQYQDDNMDINTDVIIEQIHELTRSIEQTRAAADRIAVQIRRIEDALRQIDQQHHAMAVQFQQMF